MYYVYKTTNLIDNKIYIGVHKSNLIQKDNYLGSGLLITRAIKKHGRANFLRQILYEFETADKAYQKQKELVNQNFLISQNCYNINVGGHQPPIHNGKVVVKDSLGNNYLVSKDDSRWLSGELVGVYAGKFGRVTVKNTDGEILSVKKDDPRYLSGELVHIHHNKIAVVSTITGQNLWVQKSDPRWISGQLVGVNIGRKLSRQRRQEISKMNKGRRLSQQTRQKMSKANSGSKNIFHGSIGIYNPETNERKVLLRGQEMPEGFIKGYPKRPKRTWVNKDKINKSILLQDLETYMDQGYSKGLIKNKQNNIIGY